ncbi:MAG: hypothetical protein GYA50_07405 [Eubacteriaceae bacterium]|nr:hypothetical protein [Eubacteriaceae bacterium]
MDSKQINLIEQYYSSPAPSTVYCKECGCAIDIAENEMSYTIDKNRGRLKPLTIILLTAVAILSVALLICAHIISDLKKASSENKAHIYISDTKINLEEFYKF